MNSVNDLWIIAYFVLPVMPTLYHVQYDLHLGCINSIFKIL